MDKTEEKTEEKSEETTIYVIMHGMHEPIIAFSDEQTAEEICTILDECARDQYFEVKKVRLKSWR